MPPDPVSPAALALAPAVSADANWFVEPGEKHLVDLATAQQMAELLLKTFAIAAATGAGTEFGKMLVGGLRALVAGKPAPPPLPPPAGPTDPAGAERRLADALSDLMPRPRAAALARKVAAAAA